MFVVPLSPDAPVLLWLNGWFLTKRGLASGIVFSGTGLGGACFPFAIGAMLDHLGSFSSMLLPPVFDLYSISDRLRMDVSDLGVRDRNRFRTFNRFHQASNSSLQTCRAST
jgi:hypothetical protein